MYRILSSFLWDQISAWPQLELAISQLDSQQDRGEAFEEFCHALFKIQSRLYQIKDVWRFRNIPPNLMERLGTNTKQDKGIDGVLLHEDETITAYQAKFRIDRSITPSQRELSTFYMVSDRADYRLVVSNVDDLPIAAKERKNHGQILIDKLLELDDAFFSHLKNLVRGNTTTDRPTLVPRPYQTEALASIVDGLNKSGRGQAILACGAGKTLVGKWVCDSLDCHDVLIMVPSLALIRQTIGEWHHANTKPFHYLCVCSDKTVDAQSEDSWVVNPSDLDCRVTTRSDEVISFLCANSPTMRVIFSTYQSGEVIADALKSNELQNFYFDFVICDEAHRLAGVSTKRFNHILSDNSIRVRKRLFMTATPKVFRPRINGIKEDENTEVFSMDNEEIFGPELYRFGFRRAIQENIICDYQIVVIGVSEEETNDLAQGKDVLKTTDSGSWSIEGLAQRIALGKAISTYGIQKIFSFHGRVESASRFVDGQLADSFTSLMRKISPQTDFLASYISGAMPSGIRAKKLREFESANRGVIANAKCLGEGVNVPIVDGIFFSDPKDSVIEIVQATGRALRRKANKKTAYVMIPVLIRNGENPENVLRSSRFNSVWQVLSAMSSQDDRLQTTISLAAISKGENGDSITPRTSVTGVKGMPDYQTVIMGFPPDLPLSEYQRLFTLEAVEKTGDQWFVKFGALKRYIEIHGIAPTTKTTFQGINLGTFLMAQRTAFKNKKLPSEKLEMITALGVSLSSTGRDLQRLRWDKQLIACKAFLEINHRLPTAQETGAGGLKIGEWLAHQRNFYNNNKLPKEKIDRIEDFLGPVWSARADQWKRKFEAYKDFVDKTGKQPERRTKHNGENIGVWLTYMRKNPQGLTQEQLKKLNDLGMRWDKKRAANLRESFATQTDDEWFTYYYMVRKYLSDRSSDEKIIRLHFDVWLDVQMQMHSKLKLGPQRRQLLSNLIELISLTKASAD